MRIAPHRTSPFPALLLEPNEANAVELAARLQAAGFEIRIEGLQNYSERIQQSNQDFQGAPSHLRQA